MVTREHKRRVLAHQAKQARKIQPQTSVDWDGQELYNADPQCDHDVEALWSGVRCRKCEGWFCF